MNLKINRGFLETQNLKEIKKINKNVCSTHNVLNKLNEDGFLQPFKKLTDMILSNEIIFLLEHF